MQSLQSLFEVAYSRDTRRVADLMERLRQEHHLPQALDVLDVGCGPGDMLCEYARRGWCAYGLEANADFYLSAVSRTEGMPNVEVMRGDMTFLKLASAYDMIVALNDTLTTLLHTEQRFKALANFYQALRPGGVLLLEFNSFTDRLLNLDEPAPRTFMLGDRRVVHTTDFVLDLGKAQWVRSDEFLIEGEKTRIAQTRRTAILTAQEVTETLYACGFEVVQRFNGYPTGKSEKNDDVVLFAARKPLHAMR